MTRRLTTAAPAPPRTTPPVFAPPAPTPAPPMPAPPVPASPVLAIERPAADPAMRTGRYSLVRRVGAGGMAEVWKAKAHGPEGFEKIVAVKRVLPALAADREFIEMFVAEAKLVALLDHPNIVPVFDFGVDETAGGYYLAMEYVAGQNLASVLTRLAERSRVMPVDLALYVASAIAAALAYAHDARDPSGAPMGIVHRDISPQNVLLTYRGEVKVSDFGIAKVASALPRTGGRIWKGKIAYMSPEQATLRPVDARSDLFALGAVLYELSTGTRLFQGAKSEDIYARIVSFRADDAALASVHGDVRHVVRKALQLDPENRYSNALSMEAALSDALGSRGGVRAKAALAALLQDLFSEEQITERTDSADAEPSGAAVASSSGVEAVVPEGPVLSTADVTGPPDSTALFAFAVRHPEGQRATLPRMRLRVSAGWRRVATAAFTFSVLAAAATCSDSRTSAPVPRPQFVVRPDAPGPLSPRRSQLPPLP